MTTNRNLRDLVLVGAATVFVSALAIGGMYQSTSLGREGLWVVTNRFTGTTWFCVGYDCRQTAPGTGRTP